MSFDLVAIQIYKNILQKSGGSTKTSILKTSAHKKSTILFFEIFWLFALQF